MPGLSLPERISMTATECAPWRKRLGTFVEFDKFDHVSRAYTIVLMGLTFLSLLPICYKEPPDWVQIMQIPIGFVFLFDYVGRWMTADIRDTKYTGRKAFLAYPFDFWSIVDLLSLISFLPFIPTALRLIRLLRVIRMILVVALLRYSRGFYIMYESLLRERASLTAVVAFVIVYVTAIALIMFSVEPDEFGSVADAMYWSATTLATIGFGDFAPTTDAGRFIMFLSSIVGIAVVALPTGIITSAYVNTLHELRDKYSPEGKRQGIIEKLAQQRADELGIDIEDVTTDELFGKKGRMVSREAGKKKRAQAKRAQMKSAQVKNTKKKKR